MHTTQRIWRTLDGDLVLEGDPAASQLAYGVDDEVENRDQDAVRALLGEEKPKQVKQPPNKQAKPAANK